MSPLKRIIIRFDYILNAYLREFVKISIYDYVNFIKDFTNPNLNNDELWKVNDVPYIIIHLGVQKKKSKKDKKKPEKKEKKVIEPGKEGEAAENELEAPEEEDDEDKNKIIFKPSIKECQDFVLSSMDMIIKSTNSVNDLESDLIPFIYKKGYPNFKIDKEFPWIQDATGSLNGMIDGNVSGPLELLESYKKYEYILNVDKKALVDDLFKGGEEGAKKPLEDI
jgi:hypothetical protein